MLAVLQVSCMMAPKRVMKGASNFSGRNSSASCPSSMRLLRSSITISIPRFKSAVKWAATPSAVPLMRTFAHPWKP